MRNWLKGVATSDKQTARQKNANTQRDGCHEFLIVILIDSSDYSILKLVVLLSIARALDALLSVGRR